MVAALVVIIMAIFIVAWIFYRRKPGNENRQDIGNIQNAAYVGDNQPERRLPQVPYSDSDYEEPSDYAQLDSSKRVPIDANYQSLTPSDYTQLDSSKRVPIDANYQSLTSSDYAQLDSSKRVPVDANYQSLTPSDYTQLDSSKRVPIDANYQSLTHNETQGSSSNTSLTNGFNASEDCATVMFSSEAIKESVYEEIP